MTKLLDRDLAFILVVAPFMMLGVSISTVLQKPDNSLETNVVFMGMNGLIAAIPAWIGCRRLRELKRECPDEPWLKFLSKQLILAATMVAVLAIVAVTPEAWLKAAWDFFHEIELLRMLVRSGH